MVEDAAPKLDGQKPKDFVDLFIASVDYHAEKVIGMYRAISRQVAKCNEYFKQNNIPFRIHGTVKDGIFHLTAEHLAPDNKYIIPIIDIHPSHTEGLCSIHDKRNPGIHELIQNRCQLHDVIAREMESKLGSQAVWALVSKKSSSLRESNAHTVEAENIPTPP